MPNLGLSYLPRSSPVHRLTGSAKLLAVLCVSVAAMISYDTRFLAGIVVGSVTVFALSRVRFREVRYAAGLLLIFTLLNNVFVFLFAPEHGVTVYESRHTLLDLPGGLALTAEQLFYHLNVTLKYLAIMPLALLFFVTTDPSEFASSLSRLGVSYRVCYAVAIALRYTPGIQREYIDISRAQQARGIDLSRKAKLSRRVKGTMAIVFPLVFVSLEKIETIANAMELRSFGLGKRRTWYRQRKAGFADWVAVVISIIVVAVAIWLNAINGGRFFNPFV